MREEYYLGLDLSTQSITAVVINPSDGEVQELSINFDEAYPKYQTRGGVLVGEDPTVVFSDPRMWVEAIDDILGLLQQKGITRSIMAVAVSAQQHGSAYLKQSFEARLTQLDPGMPLCKQLQNVYTRSISPIWMDSSTHQECREISESVGGDIEMAKITGSIATERFTGPQIRKFWKTDPEGYVQTKHIALVSCFVTSILVGRPAPLDCGDGMGTNLVDIRTRKWSPNVLDATAPGLISRLPKLIDRDDRIGRVSKYLVQRYGFHSNTQILVGSGDNPNSLVGLGLIGEINTKAISLGTSDTYFGYLKNLAAVERSEGHIFGAADGNYMFLLCFKNGSLARERVKNNYGLSWSEFSNLLLETPPGNEGKIMLPYFIPEITPRVLKPGVRRFGGLEEKDTIGNIRAVAEAQVMAMYIHSRWAGKRSKTILMTAGGSENQGLLKLISLVFNAEVLSFELRNTAALGAAIRAAHWALRHRGTPVHWREMTDIFLKDKRVENILPRKEEAHVYHGKEGLISVYESCEQFVLGSGDNPEEKIRKFKKRA